MNQLWEAVSLSALLAPRAMPSGAIPDGQHEESGQKTTFPILCEPLLKSGAALSLIEQLDSLLNFRQGHDTDVLQFPRHRF